VTRRKLHRKLPRRDPGQDRQDTGFHSRLDQVNRIQQQRFMGVE
jgi:hypothetical protein